jgi:hypothetical protein
MAQYYQTRPPTTSHNKTLGGNSVSNSENADAILHGPIITDFDKHRETLLNDDKEEGWASELRRYTGTMQRDIKKEVDLVEWWQVNK